MAIAANVAFLEGCSTKEAPKAVNPFAPQKAVKKTYYSLPKPEVYFNDKGELLESTEKVLGVVLPKGLTLQFKDAKQTMYLSKVRISALRKFFIARVNPAAVDMIGEGVVLRAAVPKTDTGAPLPLEISILPTRGALARVTITKVGYATRMNESELRARLDKEQKRLE